MRDVGCKVTDVPHAEIVMRPAAAHVSAASLYVEGGMGLDEPTGGVTEMTMGAVRVTGSEWRRHISKQRSRGWKTSRGTEGSVAERGNEYLGRTRRE